MKLDKTHVYSACDSIYFCNPVINIWNALPDSIVKSPSVNSFKSKINSLHFCDFCAVWLYFFLGGGAC